MRRALLLCLLAVPLFAQPAGVTRILFPDYTNTSQARAALVFTDDGALWAAGSGSLVRLDGEAVTKQVYLPYGEGADAAYGLGSIWLAQQGGLAKYDPAMGLLRMWTQYKDLSMIETGSDGNVWLVCQTFGSNPPQSQVVRFNPDGVAQSSFLLKGFVIAASFGSDGALWVIRHHSASATLLRIDATGPGREFPIESPKFAYLPFVHGRNLFAAPGYLWVRTATAIQRIGFDGTTLGSYVSTMTPVGVDASGNLWLRERTTAGEEIGRLEPNGLLTRYEPFAPLPTGTCPHLIPEHGGFASAPDGRVAVADHYPSTGFSFNAQCNESVTLAGARTTITVLDPRVANVSSVAYAGTRVRRRAGRS